MSEVATQIVSSFCPICLDFYSEKPEEDYWVSIDCGLDSNGQRMGHVFHYKCILDSITASGDRVGHCPMCRHQINIERIIRLYNIDVQPKPDLTVFDHAFKIAILGKYAAGKTCIAKRFVFNAFEERHIKTEGVDFIQKCIKIGEKRILLNLWDTAGQERFRSVVSSYVKNAFGILFVYDIADRQTFDAIRDWVNFADGNGPKHTRRILVGNKLDLENDRQVSYEEGEALARELKFFSFLECSAKQNYNISALFHFLTVEMLNEEKILEEADKITKTIQVREELQKLSRIERFRLACC